MRLRWWCLVAVGLSLSPSRAAAVTSPEQFLGHRVGEDRKLADYGQIVRYLETLERESPRLRLERLGRTTLGREMVMAVISSEANLAAAEARRAEAKRLADPRSLSEDEARQLTASGKAIVLVTCNIHSSEIGASQMAMEWAFQLCTSQDPKVVRRLDDVILLLMPSINPDGTDMIVNYYRKYVGTPWEGGRLPWLYHHYAGHDNNRDWFMLNLPETRMVNRVLHHEWFPQVFLDMHQMGINGPRIFVPPNANPITPVVHPMQWRLNDLIGTTMSFRLEESGKSGVIDSWSYDAYWPGGTKNTACLKNVVGLLSEVASCRIATPVYVDPNELQGGRKGLPDYRQQTNFPNPWPGGWWHLRDIVDYELVTANALLEACSSYRAEMLESFAKSARTGVEKGRGEPYAYVVPARQHDPSAARQMIQILRENGLESVTATEPFAADGQDYPAGSTIFYAAQPYRAFLVEMMERQRYPEVRQGPDTKEIFRPYDVTAWTLPLMMGVDWARIDESFEVNAEPVGTQEPPARVDEGKDQILPASENASYRIVNRLLARGVALQRVVGGSESGSVAPTGYQPRPGDFIVPKAAAQEVASLPESLRVQVWPDAAPGTYRRARLKAPRIGLYKSWTASIDEGWTRFVLDQYEFGYKSLDNAAMKEKNLGGRYDVVILPDMDKNLIVEGRRRSDEGGGYFEPLPPPYAGGIGKEGVAALKEFVERGGTLVCLGSSASLAIDEFDLPVRDMVGKLKRSEFSLPGTLVNLRVETDNPIAWGMPADAVAFMTDGPVFTTSVPGANVDRSVVARYPEYPDQVVASGWAEGADLMTGRAAIVEAGLGRGRVELLGPRVQSRAQMVGTYKFLFNAILRAGMKE